MNAQHESRIGGEAAGRGRGGQFRGGRGRGRGRGGRGRGGSRPNQSSFQLPGSSSANAEGAFREGNENRDGNWRNNRRGNSRGGARENVPRPRLTHFLALPLGHHPALRRRVSAFTTSLLSSTPAIPGLDESIIIPARRLHLTLGVMSLTETAEAPAESNGDSSNTTGGAARSRTLDSAIDLLNELRPRILDLLSQSPLRVALQRVDIMRPDKGDLEQAHVMWAGPSHEGEDSRRLKRVSEFIQREFVQAGLVVDDRRPLKLHCTVLNTVYRKPRNNRRIPFSYAAVLDSSAFRAIEVSETVIADSNAASSSSMTNNNTNWTPPRGKRPIAVDLGEWVVNEVQICEMGSWGPEGEYVCVGRIFLN